MIQVIPATSEAQLDNTRILIRDFVGWLRQRYHDSAWLIDDYFDEAAFEAELVSLPGKKYAAPEGCLLLALFNGEPSGCVGMTNFGNGICEMKRMYVAPQYHGRGVGYALADALIKAARQAGYQRMRLDTGDKQVEAHRLYHRLGFRDIEPYYVLPEAVKARLLFMELDLALRPAPLMG